MDQVLVIEKNKSMSTDSFVSTLRNSRLFDTAFYLKTYPDVAAAGVEPLEHFVAHGAFEGRNPNRFFDTTFYLNLKPQLRELKTNPLLDYVATATHKKLATHARFDTQFYLSCYPEVLISGVDPLLHYLEIGYGQGRRAFVVFDPQFYLETYRDVAEAGLDPVQHYELYGKREGRLARLRTPADHNIVAFSALQTAVDRRCEVAPDSSSNQKLDRNRVFWGSPIVDSRQAALISSVTQALPGVQFFIPEALLFDFIPLEKNVHILVQSRKDHLEDRLEAHLTDFAGTSLLINAIDGAPVSELMLEASRAGLLLMGSGDSELAYRFKPAHASILPQGITDSKVIHAVTYYLSQFSR